MKIDSSFKPAATGLSGKATSTKVATTASAQEAVSLSSLAGSLQNSEQPPVDSARIQEIKQAISEGRFQINTGAIADRLIDSARDLLNSKQRQA